MLIIVKNGYAHRAPELGFDHETGGSRDVLEVDPAHRGLKQLTEANQLLGIPSVDLDVEDVNAREALEEDSLPLHNRLCRQRTDVAQPQDGRTVRHHRDQVSARRVLVHVVRILVDRTAGLRHSRAVGERQLPGGRDRLGRNDLDFSGAPF